MPVHDWSRVVAGVFHDFHATWIVELRNALNGGLLPPEFDAMAEQVVSRDAPDVVSLQRAGQTPSPTPSLKSVREAVPQVRTVATLGAAPILRRRNRIAVRHTSDDTVVAVLEIVPRGNKDSRRELRRFVRKSAAMLARGVHLLIADLQPPTRRDPNGLHGVLAAELGDDAYAAPAGKPLTLASYVAGPSVRAFVEPVAIGDRLPDMPLFLTADDYVNVPLEATYANAYRVVPTRWRDILDAAPRP